MILGRNVRLKPTEERETIQRYIAEQKTRGWENANHR